MPKATRKYNNTSRSMKAAGIGASNIRKEQFVKREPLPVPGKDKPRAKGVKPLQLGPQVLLEMGKDKARGMSDKELSEKYSVAQSFVREALHRTFTGSKTGAQVLKGVLLENAIGAGMQVAAKMDELNAMQSAVVTGIMTQRYVDLEKHTQDTPPEVDYAELQKVGKILSGFRSDAGLDDDTLGEIIDIQAEVESGGD